MLEIAILLCLIVFIYYIIRMLLVVLDRSLPWFLVCLFMPLAIYVFAFIHWDDIEKPFLRGHIVILLGLVLLGVFISQQDPASIPAPTRPQM